MSQRSPTTAPATAPPLDWSTVLTEREQRDRENLLPCLMLVANPDCLAHPQELLLRDEDLARRIVTENVERLERACAVQRRRGLAGHWTYDKALHVASLALLNTEQRIRTALEKREGI
jgi:hypothetical protein